MCVLLCRTITFCLEVEKPQMLQLYLLASGPPAADGVAAADSLSFSSALMRSR